MWVAHSIIVSAQGPNPSFFLFLGDFYSTWEPVGTRTWTRAWQLALTSDSNNSLLHQQLYTVGNVWYAPIGSLDIFLGLMTGNFTEMVRWSQKATSYRWTCREVDRPPFCFEPQSLVIRQRVLMTWMEAFELSQILKLRDINILIPWVRVLQTWGLWEVTPDRAL